MTLAEKIKLHRKELGLTQTQFGDMLGVQKNAVSKWETGRVEEVPSSKIKMMAKIFNVQPSYLIDDIENYAINSIRFVKKARLGTIACGEPILAEENIECYDQVPDYVNCDFTLVCKGDSMIDARIYDGDVVCIKQCPVVDNGTISAVRVDGECTLKRVYLEKDKITLMPCNSKYAPMVFVGSQMADIQIIGKATYFISQIR